MDCVRDPITGKPIGSIVYDQPSKVPEWLILNLLPLGAIGFGNTAKAVAMIQKIMEEEGHGVREAVIKGVKLFGVTDPEIIDKIRCTGSPKPCGQLTCRTTTTTTTTTTITPSTTTITAPTKTATATSTRSAVAAAEIPQWLIAPLARLSGGAKARPHERWMLKYLEVKGGEEREEGGKGEERGEKAEVEAEEMKREGGGGCKGLAGEGSEKDGRPVAGGMGRRYVPPHLRHRLPTYLRS